MNILTLIGGLTVSIGWLWFWLDGPMAGFADDHPWLGAIVVMGGIGLLPWLFL